MPWTAPAANPETAMSEPEPYHGVCACGHTYPEHAPSGGYCVQPGCRCLHHRRPPGPSECSA